MVDEDWEKLWTMPRAKALALASWKGLDLVQINYDPKTKVCTAKIVDFGKYQYEKKKAESEKRKKQKTMVQKEIKFWYNIWDHDLALKVKKAIEFLSKWNPVKVNVVLRWREKAYKDIVRAKLDWVEEQLREYGKSQWVKSESFGYTILIVPSKRAVQQKAQQKKKNSDAAKKKESIKKEKPTKSEKEEGKSEKTEKKVVKKVKAEKAPKNEDK